ncbi:MAG: fibronectin type III domain-containing protein [Candidatus Sumerlaeota bacterium]|nr:fibronectin type III domain-containing protein [Candidatus Sumerlaeota bacterium]
MRHGTFATSMVCNATASQQVCAALKFSFALKRRTGRFLPVLAGLVCLFGAAPAAGNGEEKMGNIPRAATWVTDGTVNAIVRTADKVYIGGTFHNVGPSGGTWTPRNHIAALDASTGAATAWDPNANDLVRALAVSGDGSTVYAGGSFSNIGGQTRNYIAALNASTGNAITTWNPNANSIVYALAVSGTTVYAGGSFTTVNGTTTRNYIAALNASTGNATTWNPNANDEVYALAVSGSIVYAGGWFTSIGGQTRNYIAALNASDGLATTWNPNANSAVRALAVSGTTVYAGGNFNGASSIGGQTRNHIAALNATGTGTATTWDPNAGNTVYALAVSYPMVYAGGIFMTISGQTRNCIAALDATVNTNNATAWNPNANNTVRALAVSGDGSMVYAGGAFDTIGGASRTYFAQFGYAPITPVAPTVTATGDNELDVTVSADANPESTVYAISNVTSGNWVQADGSGGASPVWATRGGWGTVTVKDLTRLTLYNFTVTARNDGGVETVAGPEGSASTLPVGLSMMILE